MNYDFVTVDVFTDEPFGGNPLAVLPDARGLSSEQMQRVAREFNLSETSFILPPEQPENTARVRIFTPATELPFAGHPTIGTAYVLATMREMVAEDGEFVLRLEERVGRVDVRVRCAGGAVIGCQLTAAQLPEWGPPAPAVADLADILGLAVEDIGAPGLAPVHASVGFPFLYVPLRSRAAVAAAALRTGAWERLLRGTWAENLYLFAPGGEPGVDYHARMFGPGVGVPEDPATGGAAVGMAAVLAAASDVDDATLAWVVEQGIEMGRPSRLEIEADRQGEAVVATRVGGATVPISRGTIDVP